MYNLKTTYNELHYNEILTLIKKYNLLVKSAYLKNKITMLQ